MSREGPFGKINIIECVRRLSLCVSAWTARHESFDTSEEGPRLVQSFSRFSGVRRLVFPSLQSGSFDCRLPPLRLSRTTNCLLTTPPSSYLSVSPRWVVPETGPRYKFRPQSVSTLGVPSLQTGRSGFPSCFRDPVYTGTCWRHVRPGDVAMSFVPAGASRDSM